jgi:hypothetical protein
MAELSEENFYYEDSTLYWLFSHFKCSRMYHQNLSKLYSIIYYKFDGSLRKISIFSKGLEKLFYIWFFSIVLKVKL